MRLLSLSLERFGPFTDRLLTFREGAKLHLVHGPNEAGKSSSLAAIGDLLFGIPRKTRFAFVHQERDLRLGATLLSREGLRFDFRRKPGGKGALIGADGNTLPDDALAPWLGGLSREVFGHAFGLDAESLRANAEMLLDAEGDMGASLLAAASGLRGLVTLRQTLDDEADQIYGERKAQHRLFYQALARYEEASEAIRKDELKADDWKTLNAEIERLGADRHSLKEQRVDLAREQARLERLKRIAPLFDAIDGRMRQIEALGDLPEVPPGFARHIEDELNAAEAARKRLADLLGEKQRAEHELASIAIDIHLLDQAETISELFARTQAYAASRKDLPRVVSERDEKEAALRQCGASLGLTEGILREDQQPSSAAIARVTHLIRKGRAAANEVESLRHNLRKEEDRQRDLLREKERLGVLSDPAPLLEQMARLGAFETEIAKYTDLRQKIRAETQALDEAAARLQPRVTRLDDVVSRPLPSNATIQRFQTDFATLETEIRREEEKRGEALERAANAREELARLAGEGPVPSREAILAARGAREALWDKLRQDLLNPGTELQAARVETIAAFDRCRLEADDLADRAAGEAQRIAAHLRFTQSLKDEERKADEAVHKLADQRARQQSLAETWGEAWAGSGLTPLMPAEMQAFAMQLNELLRRREGLLREHAAWTESEARLAVARPGLAALAKILNLEVLSLETVEAEDLANLYGRIGRLVQARKDAWDGARDLAARERQFAESITDLRNAVLESERDHAVFATKWSEAVSAIGLRREALIEEAEAALDVWRQAPALFEARNNRARRVEGMQRDQKLFESETVPLLADVAPDLAALPHDHAIKTLHTRLVAMQKDQSRREECCKTLQRFEVEMSSAEKTLEQAEARLADHAASIGAARDDLAGLWPRLAERESFQKEIEARKQQIHDLADGYAEADLRDELAASDRDRLDADLQALREEGERLVQKSNEIYASQERHLERRQKLEGGDGVQAEIALQRRRNAEAEMLAAARDYVVKKIGGKLIERAITRAREERQSPLLRRASEIFAHLTGGDWAAIEQEFDADDKPHLVGRKSRETIRREDTKEESAGKAVPVIGMSEGTRDQLYLALRLAYLTDYAERAEAAPFIGDDLFASFDDVRTGHGLRALAAIGDLVQPILFTHHHHVVEIAKAALGDAVDVIELYQRS
ncbi:ATP-binding protein [Beijerinckia indica]|uniref:YhaN AAA domain-containing protein n=1 Tax=Beijerinckia indica subsp. indica (strain ATCC 9039 / DSM 1715 / NCIMB 8712) TaxID=395963 RepID=B2IBU8_BEII9|nr:YhaN family protein [Beijerinckia indica]ACB93820.1 conserved hypothetical protein [Beijerinckia indica subsp. indica ATCC 9039]